MIKRKNLNRQHETLMRKPDLKRYPLLHKINFASLPSTYNIGLRGTILDSDFI